MPDLNPVISGYVSIFLFLFYLVYSLPPIFMWFRKIAVILSGLLLFEIFTLTLLSEVS